MIKLTKILLILTTLLHLSAFAQPQRVGVVLSGGGSKGLYHIGVLRALEQKGVPIDYIGGTSMGAIVGAMYAAGYTTEQMEELMSPENIQSWMTGKTDPIATPYYRQIVQQPSFINIGLDLGNEKIIKTPTNLISSTPIDLSFMELLSPATAACKGDFDNLMIPFMCVASDVANQNAVILRHGDLGGAVRASMAIPIAFKPAKIDSLILFDGGIYNNYPWQLMIDDYSLDYIIGSNCSDDSSESHSKLGIMDQAITLIMQNTDYDIPEDKGISITSKIDQFMLDFNGTKELIELGYNDTMEQIDSIMLHVKQPVDSTYYTTRREQFQAKSPTLQFDSFKLNGLSSDLQEYLHKTTKIDKVTPDKPLDYPTLKERILAEIGQGDIQLEQPKALYDSITNNYTFQANFKAKSNFKVLLGGNISSTPFNQLYVGLRYKTFGKALQTYNADLYLGPLYTWGELGGRTDFYLKAPLFLTYNYRYASKNLTHGAFGNLTPADNFLKFRSNDNTLGVGIGTPISKRSYAALNVNAGIRNLRYENPQLYTEGYDHTRFTYFASQLKFERNTFNKPLYPTRGSKINLSAIYVRGKEQFAPYQNTYFTEEVNRSWFGARFKWDQLVGTNSSWFALGFNLDAVWCNQPSMLNNTTSLVMLPSYNPTPHSNMLFMPQYSSSKFLAGGLMPMAKINKKLSLQAGVYAMWRAPFELATELNDGVPVSKLKFDNIQYISNLSLVYHTTIGPVSLSFTKYDWSDRNLYLTFNFGYTLFAKRGTFY